MATAMATLALCVVTTAHTGHNASNLGSGTPAIHAAYEGGVSHDLVVWSRLHSGYIGCYDDLSIGGMGGHHRTIPKCTYATAVGT